MKAKLSKAQSEKVKKALEQHEKFKNSYFWTPPAQASNRRSMEKGNNWCVHFKNNGHTYRYESNLSVSSANVYYWGEFYLNGEKKNCRLFKELLK